MWLLFIRFMLIILYADLCLGNNNITESGRRDNVVGGIHIIVSSPQEEPDSRPINCFVKPVWAQCYYYFIKWTREYRWKVYYDAETNDCHWYKGCTHTNHDLYWTYNACYKDCHLAVTTTVPPDAGMGVPPNARASERRTKLRLNYKEKIQSKPYTLQCVMKPDLDCENEILVERYFYDFLEGTCKLAITCQHDRDPFHDKNKCESFCNKVHSDAAKLLYRLDMSTIRR